MVTQKLDQTKKTGTMKASIHMVIKDIQGPNAFHRIHITFQNYFHSTKTLDLIFINHLYKIQIEPSDKPNKFWKTASPDTKESNL
jgi:hypothetical protein